MLINIHLFHIFWQLSSIFRKFESWFSVLILVALVISNSAFQLKDKQQDRKHSQRAGIHIHCASQIIRDISNSYDRANKTHMAHQARWRVPIQTIRTGDIITKSALARLLSAPESIASLHAICVPVHVWSCVHVFVCMCAHLYHSEDYNHAYDCCVQIVRKHCAREPRNDVIRIIKWLYSQHERGARLFSLNFHLHRFNVSSIWDI